MTDRTPICIACHGTDDLLDRWVGSTHVVICRGCAECWREFVWADVLYGPLWRLAA